MKLILPYFSAGGLIIFLFPYLISFLPSPGHEAEASLSSENGVIPLQVCQNPDTEPPTASNPPILTAECSAPPPDPEVITDEADNCPGQITVAFVNDVSNNQTCPETITRTYSVTDQAGNSITVTQFIIIDDSTNPGVICPPNITIEAGEPDQPSSTGFAAGIDNCTANPAIVFFDNPVPGNCPVVEIIERNWAVVDDCSNTSFCIQTIDLLDTTPPEISCPPEITVESGVQEMPAFSGFATATDNADQDVDITFSDNVILTGNCPVSRVIERTWTAVDDCGNMSSCLQIINATDFTDPVISCPADLTINFGESDLPSNTGNPVVIDNADPDPNVIYSDNVTTTGTCPAINTIERTWTATDECGNSASCIQLITVINLTAPQIICPETSNNPPIDIFENEPNESPDDLGVITLTHESSLGGSVGLPQTDQVDHWIIQNGTSGAVTLEFQLSLHPLTVAALTCFSDSARTIMVNSSAVLPFDPPITEILVDTLFYSIIIQNPLAVGEPYDLLVTGPALESAIGETILECPPSFNTIPVGPDTPQDPSIDPSVTGMAFVQGNPSSATISYQDMLTGPDIAACPGLWTVERTWTASDTCGQFTTCTEFFIFNDYTQPQITCPPDLSINAGDPDQPPATGTATGIDNCTPSVDISFSDEITTTSNCNALQLIERTWTAIDDCGNASVCVQTISKGDFSPPVITCPADITISCDADTQPGFTGFATATDFVDPQPNLFFNDTDVFTGNCPVFQTIQRTWTAIDDCGNLASCQQIISLTDNDTPLILCPPDVAVECGSSTNPSVTGSAMGFDNCGNLQFSYSNSNNPGCGNSGVITRTWTVSDVCGSTADCTQVIIIEDNTSPVINCPLNTTVECGQSTDPQFTGQANGNDACSNIQLEFNDNISPSCGNSGTISRTWTATDDCGNSNSCIQTIIIEDLTPPLIACPPNITIECGTPDTPAFTGQPSGSDACGGIQFDYSDNTISTCAATAFIERNWTGTDDCGNLSACQQLVTIDDSVPPVLNCPSDINLECGDPYDPSVTGMATGTDACGMVQIIFTDDAVPDCPGTNIVNRLWVATDECNNLSSCVQVISFGNPPPPVLTCPNNVTIECGDMTDPGSTGQATTILGCGTVQVSFSDSFMPACGLSGVITRTWTAVDDCNQTTTCDQIITVTDNTPPMIACPSAITIECGSSSDPSFTGEVTASDNCGTVQTDFSDNFVPGCGSSGTIIRTWTVTDDCGNSLSCPQLITVEDSAPPAISCPADILIQCGESTDPASTGMATGGDACGQVQVGFTDSGPPNCPSVPSINRTWTATDECGNAGSCVQVITLDDSPPPIIFCPPNITIECGPTDPSVTGQATTVFGCGNIQLLFFDNLNPNCGSSGLLTRTWTATDDCGNVVTCNQLITLNDNLPPDVFCPPDITVDCSSSVDPSVTGQGVAIDMCGDASIFFSDLPGPGCGNSGTIVRTWGAFDGCFNFNQCEQIITVSSNTSEEIVCPADVTVPFGQSTSPSVTGSATWPGSCGLPNIGFFDSVIPGCLNSETILRLWSGTDQCGNTSQCAQTIEVVDPASLMLSGLVTNQSDLLSPNGAIDLSVANGNPPFSFLWSNGATTEDISGLTGPNDYFITVSDISGCTVTDSYFVDQEGLASVEFCITVFLSSTFNPFAIPPAPPLTTNLRDQGLLPAAQPFSGPPWNYAGQEVFTSPQDIPADMVDWMLLRLRRADDPLVIAYTQALILRSDGTLTDTDGSLPVVMLDPNVDYWIEINHVNHLPVFTPAPVLISSGTSQVFHDFTTGSGQAYTNPVLNDDPMMEMLSVNGVSYGMVPANVLNLDCMIDANDLNLLFQNYDQSSIYAPWDTNRDGSSDINDVNQLFNVYLRNGHKPY